MNSMTKEEADALDKYYTEHDIMPDMNRPGYFETKYGMNIQLDPETTSNVVKWANKVNRTPAQVVIDLVRRELATAVLA
jgi:hypothetical protein